MTSGCGEVAKRTAKVIKDKKLRGEWAESVFMARASEQGLPVSKPWGDSRSFDCVVGRPGKFAAVQVKSTITRLESGKGYICSVCSSHKAYRAGAFDFLAAYVIPEDVWYIVPAREIRGLKSISLGTATGEAKYELYREAWDLLRKAAAIGEEAESVGKEEAMQPDEKRPRVPANAFERMQAAANYARKYLQRGGAKEEEE
jgi:hypothetical protein